LTVFGMSRRTSTLFGWLRRRRRWALALLPTLVLFGTSSAACAMTAEAFSRAHATTHVDAAHGHKAPAHTISHGDGGHEHGAADTHSDHGPSTPACAHCGHDHGSAPGSACASGSDLGKAAKSTLSPIEKTQLVAALVLRAPDTLGPAPPLIVRSALESAPPLPSERLIIRYCVLLI